MEMCYFQLSLLQTTENSAHTEMFSHYTSLYQLVPSALSDSTGCNIIKVRGRRASNIFTIPRCSLRNQNAGGFVRRT